MAQELDDGEFWLPSEFLTDDELLMDFKTDFSKTKRDDFSSNNSFGFSSGLSSPVESVVGSTETESDEDELLSGLTRKMAHSTLQDKNLSTDYTEKGLKLSGSPQSTLCGFKPGSSQSSPNCGSRVSSPPDAKDGWDLLYAAAEEVVRMRRAEDTTPFRSTNLFPPPPVPNPVAVPVNNSKPTTGVYQSHHAHSEAAKLAYLQLQANHFQRIKQQQMMKTGVWEQGKTDYQFQNPKMNGEVGKTQGLSMASWPTLQQSQQQQQQPGPGMRAVFLRETVPQKERTGTGVFLPRRYGTTSTETRKKPGCSTVLLPEKVVHALNLNLNSVDARPVIRNNGPTGQQRRAHIRQPVELRLPQEWTY